MSNMSNKEYTSELGKLYQSKRDEAPLRKIVFEVYSLFKFWIESGEMLPTIKNVICFEIRCCCNDIRF